MIRRCAVTRCAVVMRTPSVLECCRRCSVSRATSSGADMTVMRCPDRPFFIKAGVTLTSSAPASIRSSHSAASTFGAMSSMFVSMSVTPVVPSIFSPIQTASALPGVSRLPIPYPIDRRDIAGRSNLAPAARMAAPVGVTSSHSSSVASKIAPVPSSTRTLAGAGSGIAPMRPRGTGKADEKTWSTSRLRSSQKVPIRSTRVSAPPSSCRWTWSSGKP